MSGPKAEAILSRSNDPTIKKRKKKPKNEDYVTKLEAGEGLKLRDEDEWKHGEDVEMVDGEDAPSTFLFYWMAQRESELTGSRGQITCYVPEIQVHLGDGRFNITPSP